MRNALRTAFAAALLGGLLWAPQTAHAQTVGGIVGSVYDQAGLPLPGVKIVASSPSQIGGDKVTYSSSEGTFRLTGLTPGKFIVTASAPKLRTVKSEVRVTINSEANIDLVMEVETEVVVVKVVEKRTPTVNVTDTHIKETFDEEFINSIPIGRGYQDVAALTAGVTDDGSGNPTIRGGTNFNNSYTVDGVDTTDPVTHTFGMNFSFNAMADVEVTTGSLGAENANTTGGVINVVTKSGSNKFEVDAQATYSDQHLQFFKDNFDRGVNRTSGINLAVGGPIIKDKLWFFISGDMINNVSTLSKDPNGLFPDHPAYSVLATNPLAKLTWQITPRNKLQLWSLYSVATFNNQYQSLLVEPEAENRQLQQTNIVSLGWESLLRDDLFLHVQTAWQRQYFDVGPQSCTWDPNCANQSGTIDVATGVVRNNDTSLSREARTQFQGNLDFEWFKDSKRFGNHDVKLGTRFKQVQNPTSETVPGDATLYTLGGQPYAKDQYCANDPHDSGGVCRPGWLHTNVQGYTDVTFLQDSWKPNRYVTLTPGVAMDIGHTQDYNQVAVTTFSTFTPHFSAVWDATKDGKTAVRASFNQNVDTGFLALARFVNKQLFDKFCYWDPASNDYTAQCSTQGGAGAVTVGEPNGPTGPKTKLNPPRTWEYTLGAEREILTGVSLGADFVYRKFTHQFEDVETNLIWNQGGTGLNSAGGYKDGKSHYVFDLETPSQVNRRYEAVTGVLRKKEGRLKVVASYTWARNEGQTISDFATAFLDNPANSVYWYGYLPNDIRHDLRAQGSYQITPWLSGGVVYSFQTGTPYNRYFYNPVYHSFTDFRAQRGFDPRDVSNPDDDRPLRLPDISELSVQARANLKKFLGQQVEVWADVFNVLALRTNVGVFQNDGPLWGLPSGARLAPTRVRVGLRYRY